VEVVESAGAATDLATSPTDVRTADWYVLAVPADIAGPLLTPVAAIDPSVAHVSELHSAWMSGVQLYLAADETMAHGHVLYLNSPWSLTSISQAQFWPDVHLTDLGDGRVTGVISVDICDFNTPGLNGKAAKDCTHDEIVAEVIAQLAAHQDEAGKPLIVPADVIASNIDDDIRWPDRHPSVNVEPMLINTTSSWPLRPDATTAVPNLVLASDYVRTNTDLATMEGANEAARRAVNALLITTQSSAPPCRLWTFDHPRWSEPLRALDELRWKLFGRDRQPRVPVEAPTVAS
jgi:15-cis-phytoene desaturase